MFMTKFWGHGSNIMCFVDHKYPLMTTGWGATADYILLEDGMEIDLTMYSNNDFWMDGYFAYLSPSEETIDVGTTVDFTTMLSPAMSCFGYPLPDEPASDMYTAVFDENWNEIVDLSDIAAENGTFSYTFDKEGKYYVIALDPYAGDPDNSTITPATAVIQVGENGLSSIKVDANGNKVDLNEDFNKDTLDYTAVVSPSTTEITLSAETFNAGSIVSVNGSTQANEDGSFTIPITSSITKIEISVTGKSGNVKTYTITVKKPVEIDVSIKANPEDATIFVTDSNSNRILPASNGLYRLVEGDEYSYIVSKNEYETVSGSFIASPDELNITLKKAEENSAIDKDIPSHWPTFRGEGNNNCVVDSKTPKNADEATLYWAVKAGSGYGYSATGSPIFVDDNLVFCSGTTIYKMNKYTGEILDQGELVTTSNFNIVPPLYANGMIFIALKNGTIQALNADTLESLWVYNDSLKGQPNSPIVYKDGYIYTGFWNSETKDANFVCVSVTDEDISNQTESKLPTWTYKQKGGFYWAGAYVNDNFLLVGTDDGQSGYLSDTSSLLSLNPKTGELIDKIENLNGDIRSSVAYDKDTNRYYFSSKGGSFYGVSVNDDGTLKDLKEITLTNGFETESKPAMCTSTPVVHNGRAYIGVSGTAQFSPYSGHNITVIDLESWKIAYTAPTRGYPQVSGLLTTAYEDSDGYAYVYFIDNYTPGEIRVLKDKPGVTSVVDGVTQTYINRGVTYTYENCAPVLFTPSGAQSQYAICSPISDEEGTLYFKNDSAYIMALGSKIQSIEITSQPDKTVYIEGESFNPEGMKAVAHLSNGIDRDITKYISFPDSSLTKDNTDVTIYYNHVMYGDKFDAQNGNQIGVVVDPLETYVDISVLSEEEYIILLDTINLIDNIGDVTINSESAINEARIAYDKLSDNLKDLVDNYNLLLNAEAEFAGIKGEVETIEKLIEDIGEVTYDSKNAVEAARAGYDALDDELKKSVSNYDKLLSAEDAISVIESEIKKVEEKITEIGNVTLEKEEAINSAREAFNALPEQSQSGVKNAKVLTKAEESLKKLKDGIENVISMIDNIGDVTLTKETEINNARTAYNALNEEQKEKISNYETLVKAEEKLAELKASKSNDNNSSKNTSDSNVNSNNSSSAASNYVTSGGGSP
ncbi:MAG: cadherin-like beta sandwich domain-containing protein, partial [Ruminococcus sp.]|nr:cadherin-like beta sandwich domain-containing protein [Ruminococcus sp.]